MEITVTIHHKQKNNIDAYIYYHSPFLISILYESHYILTRLDNSRFTTKK